MSFIVAILDGFKRPFDFSSRTTRTQFWFFLGFFLFALYLVNLFDSLVLAERLGFLPGEDGAPKWATSVLCLLFALPLSACAVRRVHDSGLSGIWLVLLIPLVVFLLFLSFPVMWEYFPYDWLYQLFFVLWQGGWWMIFLLPLVLLMLKGQKKENRYGHH